MSLGLEGGLLDSGGCFCDWVYLGIGVCIANIGNAVWWNASDWKD